MSLWYPCVYCTEDLKCTKYSDDEVTSYCLLGPCHDETKSNADRIRSMTDEELANQLVSEQYVAMKMVLTLLCQKLEDEEILDERAAKELLCNFENDAKKRWDDMLKEKLEWLKSPVEEVDNGT